jgi:hypothetical protein
MADGRSKNGGPRPNSGRPSLKDEGLRVEVIDKCWDLIKDFITDANQPLRDKIKTAEHLAGKSVPQNHTVDGSLTHNHFLTDIITKSKVLND